MFDFPKPKLGDVSAITIGSTDLEQSYQFYQQLGFTELYRLDFPFPLLLITDEALLIMLRKDNNPYIALTYYVNEMDKVVDDLKSSGMFH